MNSIILLSVTAGEKIPNWFAVTMGIGTVFVGLISIIVICLITGALFGNRKAKPVKKNVTSGEDPRERQKILAAVCAACAEDMGADVSRIRVVSFKKI